MYDTYHSNVYLLQSPKSMRTMMCFDKNETLKLKTNGKS